MLDANDVSAADTHTRGLGSLRGWGGQADDGHGNEQTVENAYAHDVSYGRGAGSETADVAPGLAARHVHERDARLVRRFQNGDHGAFGELYACYSPILQQICRARLGDPSLVEDAVQETFTRGLRALPEFRGGELFGHWLKRTAVNHCRDILRRHERRNVSLGTHQIILNDTAAERRPLQIIEREAVRSILRRMPERDAALLLAHHVDKEPVAILAERWGQTPGAMKVTLHRARQRFRTAADGLLNIPPLLALRRWLRHVTAPTIADAVAAAAPVVGAAVMSLGVLLGPANAVASPPLDVPYTAMADRELEPTSIGQKVSPTATGSWHRRRTTARTQPLSHKSVRQSSGASEVTAQERRPVPVELAPVPIPAAGREVRQAPPAEQPDMEYGIRVEEAGSEGSVWVEVYDDEQAAPIHEVGCAAARSLPKGYCTKNRRARNDGK